MSAASASFGFRRIGAAALSPPPLLLLLLGFAIATDPYVYYDWTVSYITAAPLGVKQQVCYPFVSFHIIHSINCIVEIDYFRLRSSCAIEFDLTK